MINIMFICHGNICRSPLAEICAAQRGVATESYGLACKDGAAADPRAIRYAYELGLDLTQHRSRNIELMNASAEDLIVVMEPSHLLGLQGCDTGGAQITLAGLWLSRRTPYIHDPYSSSPRFFHVCEAMVAASANNIVDLLKG